MEARELLEALRALGKVAGIAPGAGYEVEGDVVTFEHDEIEIVDPLSSPGPHCEPVDPEAQYGVPLDLAVAMREHNRVELS